jgi:hypothetical protein
MKSDGPHKEFLKKVTIGLTLIRDDPNEEAKAALQRKIQKGE